MGTNGGFNWQWAKVLNEQYFIAFQPQRRLYGEINTDVLGANFFSSLKDALALERRSNGKKSGKIKIYRQDGFPVRMAIFEAMRFCWENNPRDEDLNISLPLGVWLWVVEPGITVNPEKPQCLAIKALQPTNGQAAVFSWDTYGRPCLKASDAQLLLNTQTIDAACTLDHKVGIMPFDEAYKYCYERMS